MAQPAVVTADERYLSDLLGRPVADSSCHRVGVLRDVLCGQLGESPPRVDFLVATHRGPLQIVAGADAEVYRSRGRCTLVASSRQFSRSRAETLDTHLGRDLLDTQIIDLRVPRIARVNDVLLSKPDDAWEVAGVTDELASVIRRLLPRPVRQILHPGIVPWCELVPVSALTRGHPSSALARRLSRLPAASIVHLLGGVYVQHAALILTHLAESTSALVVADLPTHRCCALLQALGPLHTIAILQHVDERQRARILAALPHPLADAVRVSLCLAASDSGA